MPGDGEDRLFGDTSLTAAPTCGLAFKRYVSLIHGSSYPALPSAVLLSNLAHRTRTSVGLVTRAFASI
jgi:hypothetical protein